MSSLRLLSVEAMIASILRGEAPPWHRSIRLAELLRLSTRLSGIELLLFWAAPPTMDREGQPVLPLTFTGPPEPHTPEANERDIPFVHGDPAPWERMFLAPGILRTTLAREWGLNFDTPEQPCPGAIPLPPPWAQRGDEDNALIVQRIVGRVIEGRPLGVRDAQEFAWESYPPRGELASEGFSVLVGEIATMFALVELRIPHGLPERSRSVVHTLRAAQDPEHVLFLVCEVARRLARRVSGQIRASLHPTPELKGDAQMGLSLTPRPPVFDHICTDHRYEGRSARQNRARAVAEKKPELSAPVLDPVDASSASARCTRLVHLLNLLHDGSETDAWTRIGAHLATVLERGDRLPPEVLASLATCPVTQTFPVSHWWQWLRREHLRVAWPHVYRRLPVGDLLLIARLPWSGRRLEALLMERVGQTEPVLPEPSSSDGSEGLFHDPRVSGTRPWYEPATIAPPPWSKPIEPPSPGRWRPPAEFRQLRNAWNHPSCVLSLAELVASLGRPPCTTELPKEFLARLDWLLAGRPADKASMENDRSEPVPPHELPLMRRIPSNERYRRHTLPKAGGGRRWIDVPHPALASAQRHLARTLARYEPARPEATGFSPHRSPVLHARMHAGCGAAAVVDVRDFFGSVRVSQFLYALQNGSPRRWKTGRLAGPFEDWDDAPIARLVEILFHHDVPGRRPFLPQGSPASPVVANLVGHELDDRVLRAARKQFGANGWSYSRYADDLVLSTPHRDPGFAPEAKRVLITAIRSMGWRESPEKSRTWAEGRGSPLVLCGVRIPDTAGGPLELPREEARRVRAAYHHALQGSATREDRGLLAYAYSVTNRHAYRTVSGGHTQRVVGMIAHALAGERHREAFVRGWLGLSKS